MLLNIKDHLVMLVDDTPDNIIILRKTLRSEGYKIAIAPNASKALSLIPKVQPDLILLDIMMPDMDGYDVCTRLKQDPTTKDIPIIFISAKSETEDRIKGFKAGAIDYITKPFCHEEVVQRVKIHLQLHESIIQIKKKNKKLKELDILKNQLMGTVAHDLRNPIGAISNYTKILVNNFDTYLQHKPEKLLKFIQSIRSLSYEMDTLVNDILDTSAIESGNFTLNLSSVPLATLIKLRLEVCQYRAERKGIALVLNTRSKPIVTADSGRISQVIDNLIGNAIKFSPANSRIEVTIACDESQASITVVDQGVGIDAQHLAAIFDPFSKNDNPLAATEKSTGLGLAIVKKIIEAHQGKIDVTSEVDSGTHILITLPIVSQL